MWASIPLSLIQIHWVTLLLLTWTHTEVSYKLFLLHISFIGRKKLAFALLYSYIYTSFINWFISSERYFHLAYFFKLRWLLILTLLQKYFFLLYKLDCKKKLRSAFLIFQRNCFRRRSYLNCLNKYTINFSALGLPIIEKKRVCLFTDVDFSRINIIIQTDEWLTLWFHTL